MWCPKCKKNSPSVAVGNEELICAECRSEVVPSIPKPKSRVKRKAASTAHTSGRAVSLDSRTKAEKAKDNAQAVVKAWTDSNKMWRIDEAHLTSKNEAKPFQVSQSTSEDSREAIQKSGRKPAGYHLILFGVFVFLVGHGLTIWAFLAGHFGAWTIGSFCSVGGITIAVVSVVQALKDLESRLGSSGIERSRKTVRRVKRKRARREAKTN